MFNERQEYALEQLKQVGLVQVDALASRFAVTTQTIRRDLGDLCERGLAARIHGGARRLVTTSTLDYEARRKLGVGAKGEIARRASELIPDGSTVAINIGTTTEQVADALKYHKDLTVVTNNINVVHILRSARVKALIIVGGEIRPSDGAIIGFDAVEAFGNYKVDYAVIGASSLDRDGSVLDFDRREVAVSRAILANARTSILVCDQSKFGVAAPHRICKVGDLDFVVTDIQPPPEFKAAAETGQTGLVVTGDFREPDALTRSRDAHV